MVSSYIYSEGKFVRIKSDNQIKKGSLVDLYENGVNHYYIIHSLLPDYAKNWINSSTIDNNINSFNLINNDNIRPYFEYGNETISGLLGNILGGVAREFHNITGGIGREWHNTTQEIVHHPLVLAIPALAIAAPFFIPAVAAAYGAAAGAVGTGITTAYSAAAGAVAPILTGAGSDISAAYSATTSAVAPILTDVGSDISSAYSAVSSAISPVISPIEKFAEGALHDIFPVASKIAGKSSPSLISTILGGAEGAVGDVAKDIGTGLAVSLASKLLGSNTPHQILYNGAIDNGYNTQQAQAYSNQYQNSLGRYASKNNISSNDAMSQTAAYVYAHLRDYIAHGYTTAKQAIFATLKKTGGIPPTANTPISSILGSSNTISKYMPLILIGGAGILLISLMGGKKSNNKMEMANG